MPKKLLLFLLFTRTLFLFGQTDFSSQWEDFYSYNYVKDFIKVADKIYAIADNAAFIYNEQTAEIQKISSVHGLSGKETSSIYFNTSTQRFVIGYTSGLIEIIDQDGKITIANDIERLDITGQKQINHISEFENILYLSTPFGIVQYDIEKLQFGDTFYIDQNSNPVFVNQTTIANEIIYAATVKGIYTANIRNPNLIDFHNWQQPLGDLLGNFSAVCTFQNKVYTTRSNGLYQINNLQNLQAIQSFTSTIQNLKPSQENLAVTLPKEAVILNNNVQQAFKTGTTNTYDFNLTNAYAENSKVYLATTTFGILQNEFSNTSYHEIHPNGPSSNQVFSISADNNQLWVVYGGYNTAFTPLERKAGFSHFNGFLPEEEQWINTPFNPSYFARDLVHITLDPETENKAYISSWNDGIVVVENDQVQTVWNDTNSGLENLYPPGSGNTSIRINGSAFDNQNNLWVANAWVANRIKKRSANGNWSSFDMSSVLTNEAFGLTELIVDKSGSIWLGSRRNGALVFRETGDQKKALITEATKGSLPDLNVRTLAVDRYNRIWIGTQKGLVVYTNAEGVFDENIYDAEPVIVEDNGIPKKLLGDQPINSIAIDGAENKWFGTDTGGVLGTNPSGNETLFNFNKDNSPLPSNRVVKVKVDDTNGKVYFATDKGIVAFHNNVAPFGNELGQVYAYPNPVKKEHEFVTIDGRNGTHLPRRTNVKILDTAGRLVYETNVQEGQEVKGGKVVWNKTNLAGRKVASGVYIVLLTSPDKSETSSTKIAIIN